MQITEQGHHHLHVYALRNLAASALCLAGPRDARRDPAVKGCRLAESATAFELRPLFVRSTLTLLTKSLHRRELAVCATNCHEAITLEMR